MPRFLNHRIAFEAGRKQGALEERERIAKEGQPEDDDGPLTLDDVKRMSVDEVIERRADIDALLSGEAS